MATTIYIQAPGESLVKINAFSSCETVQSMSDRAGSFTLTIPAIDDSLTDAFPVGSIVAIFQDNYSFGGIVSQPPISLNGPVRSLSISGSSYMAKTQKTVVNKSYTSQTISYIVNDLFTVYCASWANKDKIDTCDKVISINFPYVFLWDAIEQLCKISGYEWFVDHENSVNFFKERTRLNNTIISQTANNYAKGSATFTSDAGRLVNKLWLVGINNLSDDYEQAISVSGAGVAIPLHYVPHASSSGDVAVVIGGNPKTVGIQNIDDRGTKDFLINSQEKALEPDLCVTGTGTITYKYKYPIRVLLEDADSQAEHGVFEDVMRAETDDNTLSIEQAQNHLYKYKSPVISGSVQPLEGTYIPGDLVKIEIDDIGIDDYFQVKEVSVSSIPGEGRIEQKLALEQPERDLEAVIKDLNARLAKLEKSVFNDEGSATAVNYQYDYATAVSSFTYNVCSNGIVCATAQKVNSDIYISFERGSSDEYFRKAPARIEYNGVDDATFTYFVNLEEGNDSVTALSVYGTNVSGTLATGTKYATETESLEKNNTVMVTVTWRLTEEVA